MPDIIVMGRNYTSRLGMIRAAGIAGYNVKVIRIRNSANPETFDEKSRYVQEYCTVDEHDTDRLLELLKQLAAKSSEKQIIIPTDDNSAFFLDEYRNSLTDSFLFPGMLNPEDSVSYYMDKKVQKELAEEVGLPVAKGWKLSFSETGFTVPDDISFPCFVKPEKSIRGRKKDMLRCSTSAELHKHLDKVYGDYRNAGISGDLLAEEFIDIHKEYDLPGFTDGEMVVLPFFIEKGLTYSGVTGTGTLLDCSQFQETYEKLCALVRKIAFRGLVDIEVYENNGTVYFNELNLRFGASGYAATGYGINLPEMLIKSLQGVPFSGQTGKITDRKSFASEKVCFQVYLSGKISWKELQDIYSKADFTFVQNNDDPEPYREFQKGANKRRLKSAVKKILRKK
ncbi:MAG: hypothetical protein K6F23_15675 [Solobacterium sp.]|nr:hypothetical protein [Solobacterium sp.]